jgi:hypothetical protein
MGRPYAARAKGVSLRTQTQGFILDLLQAAAELQSKLSKRGSEQLW